MISLRRALLIFAALAIGLAIITAILLPPKPLTSATANWNYRWPVVRGAYHIHSQRSDGTGTLDEIAAAAARAGLQFVIITDHGNGTRAPEAPTYRSGVLCIDGVEISTDQGHYVALNLNQTPFPLAGHAREVIADVHRFGGFGIAAHPGSPKADLQWDDWDAPFDGIEWLNADSEWRDEFIHSLGRVLLTYTLRPVETLSALLDRPEPVMQQWQRAQLTRRVPVLAAADAHARLGFGQTRDPYDNAMFVRVPSYDVSFAAFSNHLVLDRPLRGDAAADAITVVGAIREGHVFSVIDGLGALGAFEMRGIRGDQLVRIGEYLDLGGAPRIEAQITAPEGTTMYLLRNGEPIYDTTSGSLRVEVGNEPAAYRIEARLPASAKAPSVPWLLSNPVYVGLRDAHARAALPSPPEPVGERSGIATKAWRPEASDGSTSALAQTAMADGTPALEWRFSLAGPDRSEPYAAMRFPVGESLMGHRGLQLRAQSDAPRRIWAQLRAPGGRGERWGASLYLDPTLQSYEIKFTDFRPLGPVASTTPALDRIDSLLLVVDTVHTLPGSKGVILIPDLWLTR